MATPLSADAALKALCNIGLRVVETDGWKTRNRNAKGPWGPVHGVMLHHTATRGTQATLDMIINGRSDLPGPLSQGLIAKDGTVYLTGWGRCNHAGTGDPNVLKAVIAEKVLPAKKATGTDGNRHFYGFECVNMGDGYDPWPAAQVHAMVLASAALICAHGWGHDGDTSVIGHSEWQIGKIDPYPLSMAAIRKQVARLVDGPVSRSAPRPKKVTAPGRMPRDWWGDSPDASVFWDWPYDMLSA